MVSIPKREKTLPSLSLLMRPLPWWKSRKVHHWGRWETGQSWTVLFLRAQGQWACWSRQERHWPEGRCLEGPGKGSKERIVPIGEKAVSAIEEYLKVRIRGQDQDQLHLAPYTLHPNRPLLLNLRGGRLTQRSVERFGKIHFRVGCRKKVTPISLRAHIRHPSSG